MVSENHDRVEALDLVHGIVDREERLERKQADLAEYAAKVLREKGELVIVRRHVYPERRSLGRGRHLDSDTGFFLTQATVAVELVPNDIYLALRDQRTERRNNIIELVEVGSAEPEEVRDLSTGKVLVNFGSNNVSVHDVRISEDGHLDALHDLIGVVDNGLAELPSENRPKKSLPYPVHEGLRIGDIYNLRAGPLPVPRVRHYES